MREQREGREKKRRKEAKMTNYHDDSNRDDKIRSPLCEALSLRYITGCQSELIITSVSHPIPFTPAPHPTNVDMSHINYAGQGDFFGLSGHVLGCTLALLLRVGVKKGFGDLGGR